MFGYFSLNSRKKKHNQSDFLLMTINIFCIGKKKINFTAHSKISMNLQTIFWDNSSLPQLDVYQLQIFSYLRTFISRFFSDAANQWAREYEVYCL